MNQITTPGQPTNQVNYLGVQFYKDADIDWPFAADTNYPLYYYVKTTVGCGADKLYVEAGIGNGGGLSPPYTVRDKITHEVIDIAAAYRYYTYSIRWENGCVMCIVNDAGGDSPTLGPACSDDGDTDVSPGCCNRMTGSTSLASTFDFNGQSFNLPISLTNQDGDIIDGYRLDTVTVSFNGESIELTILQSFSLECTGQWTYQYSINLPGAGTGAMGVRTGTTSLNAQCRYSKISDSFAITVNVEPGNPAGLACLISFNT
jgi:hypothetical protein